MLYLDPYRFAGAAPPTPTDPYFSDVVLLRVSYRPS